MEHVIITLTTIPDRLTYQKEDWGLQKALKNLLNMSYDNYVIYLNIPFVNEKTNEKYVIPEWLSNIKSDKLMVFRTNDYGPITKIVPTLLRIKNPDQTIITVDDDLEYMDGFIEYHLEKQKKYQRSALGFAGIGSTDGTQHFCTTVEKDVSVKVIEGYKTVSYKRWFFEQDFFDKFVGAHWSDDIVISAYLGMKNIPKIILNYDKDTDFSPRVESFPVIGHVPCERGGCNIWRDGDNSYFNDVENLYYKLGYLDR